MSNSLLEKIKADAAARVREIEAEGSAAAEALRAETAAALTKLQTEAATALEKEKAQRHLVATSKAKQAHKLAVQQAKREALDAVFADAFLKLAAQSADAYVSEYSTRWKEAVPAGESVTAVTAPAARQDETATLLKAVGCAVTPTFTDAITAGVIVVTDGGVFDLTLDRRFTEARPELEMAVSQTLNA